LCGVGHATMKGTLMAMPYSSYMAWYNSTVVH
jgi:heme/copper-type cytochrome/quinol oxidase subunit 2